MSLQAKIEISSAYQRIKLLKEEPAPALHVEVAVLIECVTSLVHACSTMNAEQEKMQEENAALKREVEELRYQLKRKIPHGYVCHSG